MIKRPLCAAALLFLIIQAVIAGGFHIAPGLKPSKLEQKLKNKSTAVLAGTVIRREEKPDYKALYLKDVQVLLNNKIYQESKVLVYIKTTNHISIGNKIKITGNADVFEEARNPGNFNQKFYYLKQGIHVKVWAKQFEVTDDNVYWIRERLADLRTDWKKLLVNQLGSYYGNSMSAILLGDKSELDGELKDLYQKSGIGHVLAISGLHMSFLGIGLYKLLRRAGLNFGLAGGTGVCFLLAYTLMIGGGVSSIRAFTMFFVRMGADITGRDYDMPTSLTLAAAVIAAWQPLYLLDAGFLLSFGALCGIVFVYPCIEYWIFRKSPVPPSLTTQNARDSKLFSTEYIIKASKVAVKSASKSAAKSAAKTVAKTAAKSAVTGLLASLSLNLAILPVMLYYYFEFPLYSLFLNLLIIPLMPFLIGAGVVGSLITVFLSGVPVLSVCKAVLCLYEKACAVSLSLPGSRIITGQPDLKVIYAYYVLLILFCILTHTCIQNSKREKNRRYVIRKRAGVIIALVAMSVLLIILTAFSPGGLFSGLSGSVRRSLYGSLPGGGKVEVTMLDVGQGDGLYIKGPKGKSYFVDGGSSDIPSVGRYRIEPFLKSKGRGSLDYAFISHGDADHMNGIQEMLENQALGIRIRNLVLPPPRVQDEKLGALAVTAMENGTRVVFMEEGDSLKEGDMELKCLAPSSLYKGKSGNEASVVLSMSYQKFDMLFTGDLEGEGEGLLEDAPGLLSYDVLKVAHHGSKNSTTEAFLNRVKPGIAFISAGINNRYGHPHKETIARLENAGCKLYNTSEKGAVTLITDGRTMEIEGFVE